MEKKFIICMMFASFVGLQASEGRSKPEIYDLESLAIRAQIDADEHADKEMCTFRTQAKAAFFAIEKGFRLDLVEDLMDNATSHSPSPTMTQIFQDDIVESFKFISPLSKKIKEEMNNGARNSTQRFELAELLKEMEALSITSNNSPDFLKKVNEIEKKYRLII